MCIVINCDILLQEIKQLVMMFGEVNVTITNCTPQCSLDGSLMLLVTGKMVRKSVDDEVNTWEYLVYTDSFKSKVVSKCM